MSVENPLSTLRHPVGFHGGVARLAAKEAKVVIRERGKAARSAWVAARNPGEATRVERLGWPPRVLG